MFVANFFRRSKIKTLSTNLTDSKYKKKYRKSCPAARNQLLWSLTTKHAEGKTDRKRIKYNTTQEGSANEPPRNVPAKRSTDDWVAGPYQLVNGLPVTRRRRRRRQPSPPPPSRPGEGSYPRSLPYTRANYSVRC